MIHENPTYFTEKSAAAASLNIAQKHQQKQSKYGSYISGSSIATTSSSSLSQTNHLFGARGKLSSVTSYEDTEDGSELETFLSSCESNNSYNGGPDCRIILSNNNGSLRRNKIQTTSASNFQSKPPLSTSTSSLSRLGQLFKKSKPKVAVPSGSGGGGSCGSSTIESSGIGSTPSTCTPDSSLSIYSNSLDGDSHSSSTSNQISPKSKKHKNNPELSTNFMGEEGTMEDRFCSTYAFDDCGIFAANMYYNVGESAVFTIYNRNGEHPHQESNNNQRGRKGSSSTTNTSTASNYRDDDEFKDCVQPYYNNPTFSTFPNPKRCSVASAASTTTSSVVPVSFNEISGSSRRHGIETTAAAMAAKSNNNAMMMSIEHDRDGYLRPNEAQSGLKESCGGNLRNVKNLYINDSITDNNGQVHEVQVDVHTPITPGPSSASVNYATSSRGIDYYGRSNSSSTGTTAYQFDSAGSTASAATTLVAGSSLPEIQRNYSGSNNSYRAARRNGQLPIYKNIDCFNSNSISNHRQHNNHSSQYSSSSASPQKDGIKTFSHNRIFAPPTATSVAADCEPYCSLCASSIMGSPRQRSRMDVAIVKCRECFFSREAESHIQGFFDKIMTQDKQKLDVALKSYDLKDLDHPSDRVVVHCAKVQIVIISHHFLQRLKDEASRRPRLSPINRVFRSKNVIAVLLAVSAQEIMEGYESVLPRFREWFSVDLRSTNKVDPGFCKKFTEQVIKIYNVELSNTSSFSVFPKKVTKEQPKICLVLKKPVNPGDDVRVELRAHRELSVLKDIKMENPHTMLIRIPETLSPNREAIIDVSVYVNNCKIGGSRVKSELNVRRMDDDDVERMAKLLPPFLEFLDKHISETLQKHYKDCTDYTADPELELMNGIIISREDILPTIMHMAAFYGLQKTAFTVLDEADGLSHCTVKNEIGETPLDIAFARGHSQIGNMIGDYQEISNSYTAYRYIKELIDKNTGELGEHSDENGQEVEDGRPDEQNEESHTTVSEEANESECFDNPTETGLEEANNGYTDITIPHSQGSPSEFSSKSEDDSINGNLERPKKPTPTTRQRINRCSYINVKKPEENPELVETRKKANLPVRKYRESIMANYDIPRLIGQDYVLPPRETRPITNKPSHDMDSPVFRRKNDNLVVTDSGYLIMNDDKSKASSSHFASTKKSVKDDETQSSTESSQYQTPSSTPLEGTNRGAKSSSSSATSSLPETIRNGSNFKPPPIKVGPNVPLDPAEMQLIELMNDFKNNTYDMHMVELLFENWKQRPDVQKSIEEKIKSLEKWREEWRQHHQSKDKSRKMSTFGKIKSVLTKRKKSNTTFSEVSSPVLVESPIHVSANGNSATSPTGLVFSGPALPSSTVPTSSSSQLTPPAYDPRASEISHRTTIDSRWSDSSAESDKMPMGESASSFRRPPGGADNSQVQNKNPMNSRFISQYIQPNVPNTTSATNAPRASPEVVDDLQDVAAKSQFSSSSDDSYKVPPPPRPVKPTRKNPEDAIVAASPKPVRKPPVIPEEDAPSPKLAKRPPPAVPAKPGKNNFANDSNSPPPAPPPRSNNTTAVFNFIDYRKKNENVKDNSLTGKANYVNEQESNDGTGQNSKK